MRHGDVLQPIHRMSEFLPTLPSDYGDWLASLKQRIRGARQRAVLAANAEQNRLVAEYALSGIDKPIGVAEYQLVRALPESLDTSLPSIEEIEAEFPQDVGLEE
jgi:hypothetical protein